MITVSKRAVEKFKELKQKADNPENVMLRVYFGGFGWNGPRLELALDELKNENDLIVELQGIKIVFNSDIRMYVNDLEVDYSDRWYNHVSTSFC